MVEVQPGFVGAETDELFWYPKLNAIWSKSGNCSFSPLHAQVSTTAFSSNNFKLTAQHPFGLHGCVCQHGRPCCLQIVLHGDLHLTLLSWASRASRAARQPGKIAQFVCCKRPCLHFIKIIFAKKSQITGPAKLAILIDSHNSKSWQRDQKKPKDAKGCQRLSVNHRVPVSSFPSKIICLKSSLTENPFSPIRTATICRLHKLFPESGASSWL